MTRGFSFPVCSFISRQLINMFYKHFQQFYFISCLFRGQLIMVHIQFHQPNFTQAQVIRGMISRHFLKVPPAGIAPDANNIKKYKLTTVRFEQGVMIGDDCYLHSATFRSLYLVYKPEFSPVGIEETQICLSWRLQLVLASQLCGLAPS